MNKEYEAIRQDVAFKKYDGHIYHIEGDNLDSTLNQLLTKNIEFSDINSSGYSFILTSSGEFYADVTFYKLESGYILLSKQDLMSLLTTLDGLVVIDQTNRLTMIQVEGPNSARALQPICDFDMSLLNYKAVLQSTFEGEPILMTRLGYTGELGYQLLTATSMSGKLIDTVFYDQDIKEFGNIVEDYTKFEVGNPVSALTSLQDYSLHDLGYTWNMDFTKEDFQGKDEMLSKIENSQWAHVGFYSSEKQVIGTEVLFKDKVVGKIIDVIDSVSDDPKRTCLGSLMLASDYAHAGITFVNSKDEELCTASAPYVIPKSWKKNDR